jgi:hypothetical protein
MSQTVLATLEGLSPGLTDKRIFLGTEAVRIGRGSACTFILTDPMTSRQHAEITYRNGNFFITDLGSTHGTWVNGQRVQEVRLTSGSHIRLGDSEFVFRLAPDAAPSPAPKPEAPAVAIERVTTDLTAARPISTTDKKINPKLLLGCGVAVAVGFVACLGLLAVGLIVGLPGDLGAYMDRLLNRDEVPYTDEDLALALAVEMVDERPEILENLGYPDEFDIAVVSVEGGVVRRESWYYYGYGTRVDFVDGVIVWTIELEAAIDDVIFPAWYDPIAFETGMSIEAASALVQDASPAGAIPESFDLSEGGEDLAGVMMLVGDQITLAFEDGQLAYVETIGMHTQGGEG